MPFTKIPKIMISIKFDKKIKKSELLQVHNSEDSYNILKKVFDPDTFHWCEEFIMLCLNNSNKVIGWYKVSSGGMTGTFVDIRVIFTIALKCLATSIILAHNHPSGKLFPSESDKIITKKIKDAGALLDIVVLDHIIVTDESYYSFAKSGTL